MKGVTHTTGGVRELYASRSGNRVDDRMNQKSTNDVCSKAIRMVHGIRGNRAFPKAPMVQLS